MSRILLALAVALVVVAPDAAHACSVCFSTTEQNRLAFLATTIFLSVLPLGILFGIGAWLRRKVLDLERRHEALRQDPH